MSIKWMSIVWKLDGLYQSEKFVLLALADNANNEGQCWPSIPDIAQRCCLQPRQTINIIAQLTERGYLSREMRSGKSTVYTLLTPALDCSTTPATDYTPANNAPLQNPTPTPALDCSTTPAKSDITYKEEPSFEPSIEEPSKATSKIFEKFWEKFPKQRIGSKAKAKIAFDRALKRVASSDEILRGVENYLASDDVARGYAKGAAAWLNDDGWANSYKPPSAPAKAIPVQAELTKEQAEKNRRFYLEKGLHHPVYNPQAIRQPAGSVSAV